MLDSKTLQVVPLGGLGEIGKNMTAVRQESGIILVDAGMAFPDEETPGIDLILPDFTYLREHQDELKGIVLTHGHEDHVGALPYLLREFNVTVYGTKLTLGLVRSNLQLARRARGLPLPLSTRLPIRSESVEKSPPNGVSTPVVHQPRRTVANIGDRT